MQDVHWFGGSIGYFPTYALGNLYGAMMIEAARKDIPDLDRNTESGTFAPLLSWLRKNVHEHGMRFTGPALIQRISGSELSEAAFLRYLRGKFA